MAVGRKGNPGRLTPECELLTFWFSLLLARLLSCLCPQPYRVAPFCHRGNAEGQERGCDLDVAAGCGAWPVSWPLTEASTWRGVAMVASG